MKKYLIFALSLVTLLSFSGVAFAEVIRLPNPLCVGGAGGGTCIETLPALIAQITTYISTVIGAVAALMFVIAGIMFITSAGKPDKIETAKKTAIYATVGVIIAFAGTGLVAVARAVLGVS